jgi:histidine triad (HIT) family protein
VSDCVFCDIAAGEVPAEIVLADEAAVAFLDRRPLFKGHVLVIPREHYETLADLPASLVGPLFTRVQRVSTALTTALGA